MAASKFKDLKINSPAGVDPMFYSWPLQTGSGVDILDTIKWVCEDMPEIKVAFDDVKIHEIDTGCYESMLGICDQYNRAIDSVAALVSCRNVGENDVCFKCIFFYRNAERHCPCNDSTNLPHADY